jgi:NADP-dependent 3-hydroxy acid dehydrogenase YdfG
MNDIKIIVAGNKEYGLAKSIAKLYPDAKFLSRSSGYNLGKQEVRQLVAEESLDCDVFMIVSALGEFKQTLLLESIIKKWQEHNHEGYIIALGSSADTPVKGSAWSYPVEKKALRAYCRQLSQIASSDTPANWKITYLSPGNMHTPKQDEKMPGVKKLDTDYVAGMIKWLLEQPQDVNISEICLDRIQK